MKFALLMVLFVLSLDGRAAGVPADALLIEDEGDDVAAQVRNDEDVGEGGGLETESDDDPATSPDDGGAGIVDFHSEDDFLEIIEAGEAEEDTEQQAMKFFISPSYTTITQVKTVTAVETTYNTCYKTEDGILPCKMWADSAGASDASAGGRRRRNFKVEVKPSQEGGNGEWNVEIRPTRVSICYSQKFQNSWLTSDHSSGEWQDSDQESECALHPTESEVINATDFKPEAP